MERLSEGRASTHFGAGPGLQGYNPGESGGVETVTLLSSQMPSHVHGFTQSCSSDPGGQESSPANAFLCAQDPGVYAATSNAQMGAGTSQIAGGSQAHENRAPFLAMTYVIAVQGIYPSRS